MTDVSYLTCDEYEACLQSQSGIPLYSETIMQRGYRVVELFRRLASVFSPIISENWKICSVHCSRGGQRQMRGIHLSETLNMRGLELLFKRKHAEAHS